MIYLAGRRHKYSAIWICLFPFLLYFYSYDTSTLQVLTFARHPLPQTSQDSLGCTPILNGIFVLKIISENSWLPFTPVAERFKMELSIPVLMTKNIAEGIPKPILWLQSESSANCSIAAIWSLWTSLPNFIYSCSYVQYKQPNPECNECTCVMVNTTWHLRR